MGRAAGHRFPPVRAGINPNFNRPWQGDISFGGMSRTSNSAGRSSVPSVGEAFINYSTARGVRKRAEAEQQRADEGLAHARAMGIPDSPGLKGGPLAPPEPTDEHLAASGLAYARSKGIPDSPGIKGGPLAPPPAPKWNTQSPSGSIQPPPASNTLGYITNTSNPNYRPPVLGNLGYLTNTNNPHAWNANPPSGAPQSPPPSMPSKVPYVGPGSHMPVKPQYIGPGSPVGAVPYVGPGTTPLPPPSPRYIGPGSSMWQGGPGLQAPPAPLLPPPTAPAPVQRKSNRKAKPTT